MVNSEYVIYGKIPTDLISDIYVGLTNLFASDPEIFVLNDVA